MTLGAGFFVAPEVVAREVVLGDGSKHAVSFRKVSSYDWGRFLQYLRSETADERAIAQHVLIAASVCEPDGTAAMTVETAYTLDPAVSESLFAQAIAVCKPRPQEEAGNA